MLLGSQPSRQPFTFKVVLASTAIDAPPPPSTQETAATASATPGGNPTGGVDLIAVGLAPAPFTKEIALPNGNRYGSFSISPVPGIPGSPGGQPGGVAGGGTGGPGPGGDESLAVGAGKGAPGGAGAAGLQIAVADAGAMAARTMSPGDMRQ